MSPCEAYFGEARRHWQKWSKQDDLNTHEKNLQKAIIRLRKTEEETQVGSMRRSEKEHGDETKGI